MPVGSSLWNHFHMWCDTNKVKKTLLLMLFLEGTHFLLLLVLSCWVLNILKTCMPLILILVIFIWHVKREHLIDSIGMMITCLGKISFVCLIILCVSYLCERHILED